MGCRPRPWPRSSPHELMSACLPQVREYLTRAEYLRAVLDGQTPEEPSSHPGSGASQATAPAKNSNNSKEVRT